MKSLLITTYYDEKRRHRRDEYEFCLSANCDSFDEVHVLAERVETPPFESYRGSWTCQQTRQTFHDLFALARVYCQREDLCVVANADIVIQRHTLSEMNESLREREVYALTRWDLTPSIEFYDRDCSQDAWVFRGPPKECLVRELPLGGYQMGGATPGCDNKIAWDLREAGYVVLNPSKSFKTYHLHQGDTHKRVRDSEHNRLPRPYLRIRPHLVGQQARYRPMT